MLITKYILCKNIKSLDPPSKKKIQLNTEIINIIKNFLIYTYIKKLWLPIFNFFLTLSIITYVQYYFKLLSSFIIDSYWIFLRKIPTFIVLYLIKMGFHNTDDY